MNRQQTEIEKLMLEYEKQCLKDLQKSYTEALADVKRKLRGLLGREQTQSTIYQVQYQEELQRQIESALNTLKNGSITSVSDFLNKTYEDSYLGTIYGIQGRGIPVNIGIDHEQMARTINRKTDTMQFSQRLYDNVDRLGIAFKSQMSRGLANNSGYSKIAKQLALESEANYKQAMRIVRTEGGRVKSEAKLDSMKKAKDKGADIVKQWDATFDSKTRAEHRYLDGQIREIGEPFEDSQGRKAQAPHKFGIASMDINCRCIVVERARWELDGEEYPDKVDNTIGELITAEDYKAWKEEYQKQQAKQQKAGIPNNAKVFDKNSKSVPSVGDYFKTANNELVKIKEINDYNGIKSVTLENGQTVVLGNIAEVPKVVLKNAEDCKNLLKNRNFRFVGNGLDSIDEKLLIENTQQLSDLLDKYPKIQDYANNNTLSIDAYNLSEGTTAQTGFGTLKNNQMSLTLNKGSFRNYDETIKSRKDRELNRWLTTTKDKQSVATVTHEFGHMVENRLLYDYNLTNSSAVENLKQRIKKSNNPTYGRKLVLDYSKNFTKTVWADITKIAKEIDPNFNVVGSLSDYGKTTHAEAFAETFVKMELGEQDPLTEAMRKYLKGKL